jgi:hypothetical protein
MVVYGSVRGSEQLSSSPAVRQCGSVWQCVAVWQCAAVCAAACGSSAQGSVCQCAILI